MLPRRTQVRGVVGTAIRTRFGKVAAVLVTGGGKRVIFEGSALRIVSSLSKNELRTYRGAAPYC